MTVVTTTWTSPPKSYIKSVIGTGSIRQEAKKIVHLITQQILPKVVNQLECGLEVSILEKDQRKGVQNGDITVIIPNFK